MAGWEIWRQVQVPQTARPGAPLTARALEVVRYVVEHTALPVIGVGGIMTAADAARMFDAGAVLIQLYTGFIYHGPGLISAINAAGE